MVTRQKWDFTRVAGEINVKEGADLDASWGQIVVMVGAIKRWLYRQSDPRRTSKNSNLAHGNGLRGFHALLGESGIGVEAHRDGPFAVDVAHNVPVG